jgi:hypothetical protein
MSDDEQTQKTQPAKGEPAEIQSPSGTASCVIFGRSRRPVEPKLEPDDDD